MSNHAIVLAARPRGVPQDSDFRLEARPIPPVEAGQVLCKTAYLSLDPYMRARMAEQRDYDAPVAIGGVMVGQTVGQVVESKAEGFAAGDWVLNYGGWQEYAVADAAGLRRLDPAAAPVSYALGALGMPGLTAYVGLLDIGEPRPGDTVVVSAAAGAVGQLVGQIARLKGCRVIGIAGSAEKCDYVVRELGFDQCLDRRQEGFAEALKAACPNGVDVYFESVGGAVFAAVAPLLKVGARIPLCGFISQYNLAELPPGPDRSPLLFGLLLTRRITLRGFRNGDHQHRLPDFLRDMSGWLRTGEVKYREHVVDGLAQAPAAFRGMLAGENFGKLLVRVGRGTGLS